MGKTDNNDFDFSEFDSVEDTGSSVDLSIAVKNIIAHWKFILICAFIASFIGILIGFSIPKTFVSTAVVAPELTTRNTSGGLTSLANLAGININSMAVTDAMHPDMYPAIVNSSTFMISLFDLPVEVKTKDGVVNTDLYDYIANYTKSPWWAPVLGFPMFVKNKIVSLFKAEDEFDTAQGHESVDSLRLTGEQERVVKLLSHSISVEVAKKTYLLKIQTKMQDRMVAAQLANAVVEKLQRFVIDYRTERTRNSVEYYRKMVDNSRVEYLSAQRAYAYYLDRNQDTFRKGAQVESQRLQNEANLRFQLYNSMSQNLLQAEAKLQLESPVLVVIQPALAPIKGSPSKAKLAVLFFILGLGAGALWVLLRDRLHGLFK